MYPLDNFKPFTKNEQSKKNSLMTDYNGFKMKTLSAKSNLVLEIADCSPYHRSVHRVEHIIDRENTKEAHQYCITTAA